MPIREIATTPPKRSYNICEKVSNFEEKIMDTYYERQFKKKDPYIKFWGIADDRDHDKRKIEDYVAWLETITRRWKATVIFDRSMRAKKTSCK